MPSATTTRLSTTDSLRVLLRVLAPTVAGGVIKRRPPVLRLASLLDADRGAIAELARLRARYDGAPVLVRVPGRAVALVLSAADVGEVLADTPDPFTPATREKTGALARFQPHGVLISKDGGRTARREFNERALETPRPLHHLADRIRTVVRTETERLLEGRAELDWVAFEEAWWRVVRRVVLGETARDDTALTAMLDRLRRSGNWAGFAPAHRRLRARFVARLRGYLDDAEPRTLAGDIAGDTRTDPASQVAHWLFAFDAAGMVTVRALAMLATHPAALASARGELDDPALPYLRASVLDTIRLWPTTPALLRETGRDTVLGGQVLPARTQLLVFTPFFHRDPALSYADSFEPGIWLDGRAEANPALVPFSAGPAVCPGRNLVLFTTSTMLGALIGERSFALESPAFDPAGPLPATVDNFGMRFRIS